MVLHRMLLAAFTISCVNAMMTGDNGGPAGIKHEPSNFKQTSVTFFPRHCIVDAAVGQCRARIPKYFFNITSGQCEQFYYGGCGGNWNRFDTLSECHETCACKAPPETGPCRGHMRRWFYSPADGCCRPFIYGGCGGNSNNHATWTECSNLCGYPTIDSKWWKWGADWWNLNGHFNKTSNSTQSNATSYSQNDFMRDWILWGLLTGGEGELEMEEMAPIVARANVLGFGKATGTSVRSGQQYGANSFAGGQASTGSGYLDKTTGQAQLNANMYSNRDFMRDWTLWGLLTGGEGELDMENMATMIGQAHILGFGQGTGNSGRSRGLGKSNAQQRTTNSLADTQAALRYFQRYFGGEESAIGGGMGAGMQNYGPAYNIPKPGSFTPLGQVGSVENIIRLHSGSGGAVSENGGSMSDVINQSGAGLLSGQFGLGSQSGQNGHDLQAGQFGQGSQSGQGYQSGSFDQGSQARQFGRGFQTGQVGQGSQAGQFGQGSQAGQFGQGSQAGQFGRGFQTGVFGQGSQAGQFGQGSQSGQFGEGSQAGQFGQGSQAGQFGQGSQLGKLGQIFQHGQGLTNSRNQALHASAGESNSHQSWGHSISQNLGNTRNGWAPHGESVLPVVSGSGQLSNAASDAALSDGGAAILYVIGQLRSGNFNPANLMDIARRFGAMQPSGSINVETLAQRIVGSLLGQSGESRQAHLKGMAKALGALDNKGNVNINALLTALARSIGRGDLFGSGDENGNGSGSGPRGNGAAGGGVSRWQSSGSISAGGSSQGTASVKLGGGSRKKSYGRK